MSIHIWEISDGTSYTISVDDPCMRKEYGGLQRSGDRKALFEVII